VTGVARGREGPDESRTNCGIADGQPIRDRPCNRSRVSSHFATHVTYYENRVPSSATCARKCWRADSFLPFFFASST